MSCADKLDMPHFFQLSVLNAAAFAMLGVCCSGAHAQSAGIDDATHLDEVTITARSLESRRWVQPVQQLSGAALTQRQGSTLGETLDNLPGIANSSFGPNVGRPVMRGMEGDRISLLQNGGANMDVSGLSADHAVPIDPLTTERIEVHRGPMTLLYGNSAMGGVVNLIDNRIARERVFGSEGGVMGRAEVRSGGAADERSTGAMVEAGHDRFALHVDAFERTTQNLRVPKDMTCAGTPNGRRVCNSVSDSHGAAVGGTLIFDRGYLGLSTSEYRSTYGTVAEPNVSIGMARRHHVMEGVLRDAGPAIEDLKIQLGHTNYTHTEYDNSVVGTRFDNQGDDWRLEARQRRMQLNSDFQLDGMVGASRELNTLQAVGDEKFIGPSRTRSAAVFSLQSLKTAWGQINAAARAESVQVELLEVFNGTAAQSKYFNPLSVSMGVVRNDRQGEAQNGWLFTSNLTANQRAPKDYELFANGPHVATASYERGDVQLGLEKGTQLDVGAEWKYGAHTVALTSFSSQFSNYLSLQPTGQDAGAPNHLPIYTYAGVRARLYGLESSAKLRMVGGQQAIWSPHTTHGTMDFELRADAMHAQDLTNNAPLPRIAPVRLGADAVWSRNAWGARLGFTHAAAQNRVPENGVATAGYTLVNAGLNYHTHTGPTHWLLFAKLDNITNKLAYSSTSVLTQTMGSNAPPLAARNLKVGAQMSF
jgi:iron complex outermembrane recepter protein